MWATLIPVIVKYGLPLAEKLWQKWASNAEPTQADWDELNAMVMQTAKDRALKVLADHGIDPNSDQGKAILALV